MKKVWILFVLFVFLFSAGMVKNSQAQKEASAAQAISLPDSIQGLVQTMTESIGQKAADLGFDYRLRPIIGVIVADFLNPAGQDIELGNVIGLQLRAALEKGNQFHVYGKDHPVSQSLKTGMKADPQWSAASQRNFQQDLIKKFTPFPVDLIITGQVSPEAGNRVKIEVNLIPFYKTISLVESESGRTDIYREQLISTPLSSPEVEKGLAVIQVPQVAKGRVVILSSIKIKRSKYPASENSAPAGRTAGKVHSNLFENTGKNLYEKDLFCWMDDKELKAAKNWEGFRKKEYHNLLSGFEGDTIWFDDLIEEGKHSIFFSLLKNHATKTYKTFSESFSIQSGSTNYLYFFPLADALGEPQIRVHHVVDPKNRLQPF
ncbi:MAG: hypothetical protein AB1585_01855 [Thermodesulfobacteriota bacterium]